jgi:hypothetical protein
MLISSSRYTHTNPSCGISLYDFMRTPPSHTNKASVASMHRQAHSTHSDLSLPPAPGADEQVDPHTYTSARRLLFTFPTSRRFGFGHTVLWLGMDRIGRDGIGWVRLGGLDHEYVSGWLGVQGMVLWLID